MNILHVYKTFMNDTVGGVEQVIAHIARTPNFDDFEHSVLSLSPKESSIDNTYGGIKNIRYREQCNIASNAMSLTLLRDYQSIAAQYDLIHYHFPWPFADLMHLFWRIKKPSIVTYHSDIVRQKNWLALYKPIMHRFLRSVDVLVATSPNYIETSPILQRYKNKTKMIPLGISKRYYPPASDLTMASWRQRLGARFFLFVGVLRYYKGLHILMHALQDSSYPVVIVGSGPVEAELKTLAQRLKLSHVHFLGQVSSEDKNALLTLCTAMVFPSHLRSEAFGVSLLEAAMFGKPMISTEIGTGTSFVNAHEKTGLVVPPNDPVALRQAMDYIWHHPADAERMGEQAALRHQFLFTGNKMVSEYEKLYQKVVIRHRPS